MAKKKSFILYADYIKHIGKLTDEEAGRLFKAIFEYVNEGRLPDLDGMAAMAFSFISNQLDSDLRKYETVCQKRAESAKRRWQKNDDAEGINNDVEKECKSMQMHTNAVTCINLHSDSGSVLHNNTVPVPGTTTTNVHLTEKQYNDLCGKYGKEIIDRYIAKIGQYLNSNGKKPFPNHYETIVKWLTSDNIQPKRQPSFDIGRIMEHAKNNKPEV